MATIEDRLQMLEQEQIELRKMIELQATAIGALVTKDTLERLNERHDKLFDTLIIHDRLTNEQLAELRKQQAITDTKIVGLQTQITDVDGKVIGLQTQLRQTEKRIDARFEQVDARFERIDARFEQVDARFDRMEALLVQIIERLP